MFVDKAKVKVTAGTGGNGVISFIREKYIPLGGPGGGDGGNGGDVVFVADQGISTLLEIKYSKRLKAEDGVNGAGKKCHGANADDTVQKVPMGTIIKDIKTGEIIADLTEHGQSVVVAKGGRGGRGNARFATARVPAPKISENGEPGEIKELALELRVLADAGLVGFPSVGKSTLISVVSNAKPEIADYHFTTIVPKLGMTKVDESRSFVLADLPGLIEGASQGKGLGHQFLRHIERCKVIIHVIDMSGSEGRDPIEDYKIINAELKSYNYSLENRPQVVVANKMDNENATENLSKFKQVYPDVEVFETVTLIGEGLDSLKYRVADLIDEENKKIVVEDNKNKDGHHVYKFVKEKLFFVKQAGHKQ